MSKVKELFTYPANKRDVNWREVVSCQYCRYSGKRCYKTRKSDPTIAIGTCVVSYGANPNSKDIIICPHRLLERKQIFIDCLHLLKSHTPGNELHIVPEVSIPGGSVDYFLVSTDSRRKVKDFVGIELQTMDTTGTVWPERQRLMQELGFQEDGVISDKSYGMNWKMTSKTILVQLHHKINTFEHLNKHLILVVQDCLMEYMRGEFSFEHIQDAKLGDSMHFHSYSFQNEDSNNKLVLSNRCSTNSQGIERLLGLNVSANVEFDEMARILEGKISNDTMFTLL